MSEAVRSSIQSLLLSVLLLNSCAIQAIAYYHPDEGRWINRDPIGEQGGVNVYGFVGNDPIDLIDYIGLEWDVTRKGDARAKATCECGDRVLDLAKIIGLSEGEFTKWLVDEDGLGLPNSYEETLQADRVFSVPNTGYLDASTYTWGFLGYYLMGQSSQIREHWAAEGLKVTYNHGRNVTVSSILSHLGSDDIYRFVYIGHGAYGQLTGINDYREGLEEQFIPRGIIGSGRYTKYGIGSIRLYACQSAMDIKVWASNVSYRGWIMGLKADENFQWWDALQPESFVFMPGTAR